VLPDIQAVLFDMGDTLVHYPLPGWSAMARQCIAGVYGYMVRPESELPPPAAAVPEPDEARARRTPPAPGTPVQHRVMLAMRRVVRSVSGRTLPRMAEACARPFMADGRLFADVLPVLAELKSRGYRLGLVSNTPWGTPDYLWENQVERFGLARCFDVRIFSSVIGFRKPDPRIFREALARLKVEAAHALFVGNDPEADIGGAHAAGMRTAFILRPEGPRSKTDPRPDLRLDTLEDLLAYLPSAKKR
jgi:putative hydrolase of the HAD superfamily